MFPSGSPIVYWYLKTAEDGFDFMSTVRFLNSQTLNPSFFNLDISEAIGFGQKNLNFSISHNETNANPNIM
jgi:hypothetical protein